MTNLEIEKGRIKFQILTLEKWPVKSGQAENNCEEVRLVGRGKAIQTDAEMRLGMHKMEKDGNNNLKDAFKPAVT